MVCTILYRQRFFQLPRIQIITVYVSWVCMVLYDSHYRKYFTWLFSFNSHKYVVMTQLLHSRGNKIVFRYKSVCLILLIIKVKTTMASFFISQWSVRENRALPWYWQMSGGTPTKGHLMLPIKITNAHTSNHMILLLSVEPTQTLRHKQNDIWRL